MIAYDQYQRYKTISRVVEKLKAEYKIDRIKILEVGANEQKNLGKFLNNDDIYYSDIQMPEGYENDDHFLVADATNLVDIEDESYEVVVAADVFEHIPEELRSAFVSELYRVAKHTVIMCFPFAADYVEEAEIRVNEYYKTLTGEDYVWLLEHINNGLPKRKELEEKLTHLKIDFTVFEHGDVRTWEKMLQNHFFAVQCPELIPYREKLDEYYDKYVYDTDVSEENYRCFYLLYKEKEKQSFYKHFANELFENIGTSEKYLQQLDQLSRSLKDISNWKLQLESFRQHNCGDIQEYKSSEINFGVYYDYGNGFDESNKIIIEQQYYDTFVEINVPDGVRGLRIDPVEGAQIILNCLQVYSECGAKLECTTNGIDLGTEYVFVSKDPQILLEVNGINKVKIYFEIIVINDAKLEIAMDNIGILHDQCVKLASEKYEVERKTLNIEKEKEKAQEATERAESEKNKIEAEKNRIEAEKDRIEAEKDRIEAEKNRIEAEKDRIEAEKDRIEAEKNRIELLLNDAQALNQSLYHSFSWRITRPVRFVSRGLRFIKKKWKTIFFSSKKNAVKKEKKQNIEEEIIDTQIRFSIVVPLYNTKLNFLEELIHSVSNQTYRNWELCLVDASDVNADSIKNICKKHEENDARIRYIRLEANKGISENTNAGIAMAQGSYIVLCDHDDVLMEQALYMMALAIQETNAKVLYSDEDHIDECGNHKVPFFKPDWSRDLLYSQMYTCHLFTFEKELFDMLGGFDPKKDGAQDYDLMLRFSEQTNNIVHVPCILYSWRETETSTASNASAKPYAHIAGLSALDQHLKRTYGAYAEAKETEYTFVYAPRFDLLDKGKILISIIIPMKDNWEMTESCIHSICTKSSYSNYEILLLDNRSEKEDTLRWFERIQQYDHRIKVLKADFEFNWSKLNNFGMEHAIGDVYIFMNNDTIVITPDWLERLAENALRDDIGVVGPLLLYEDNTIQHAGIVVGMGGWADHIFKGMHPIHYGTPYVSPMVNRNVTAVTGACMAISRETMSDIGAFDEEFIICGSDVEICIRAYEKGYRNLYNANVKLYHLESKSRDSYIPDIDFKKSYECYTPFRENGDPFFNINLDINSVIPKESSEKMNLDKIKRCLKRYPIIVKTYRNVRKTITKHTIQTTIPEVQEIVPREFDQYKKKRLNLLALSLNVEHVFGGTATALKFYKELGNRTGYDLRVIITDSILDENAMVDMDGFQVVDAADDSEISKQIVVFSDRYGASIPVGENDIFMATAWWTAYTIFSVIKWQKENYGTENKLLYFIQDYEPGFYPWSSRYLMADSTYKSSVPTMAIFNSRLLYDFFKENDYSFTYENYFDPVLNDALKKYLLENGNEIKRKKQILIYGRPSTARNAFELIIAALNKWCAKQKDATEWNIISAGEEFCDIELCNGQKVHAVGKLSLEEYAKTMLETKVGISLMVSPHPSYPPLEMSTFGVKVITNTYANKNLESFNENIVSLDNCSSESIANKLLELCSATELENRLQLESAYVTGQDSWENVLRDISGMI